MSYLMALPVCIHLGIFRNKKISSLLALTVYFHKEGWKLEDTEKKKIVLKRNAYLQSRLTS